MTRLRSLLSLLSLLLLAVACTPAPASDAERPEPVDGAAGSATGSAAPDQPEPEPVRPTCEGEPCEPPRQCVQYYGIAGPSGPSFHACELRCERGADADGCPEGMRCTTIADGPGDVCR